MKHRVRRVSSAPWLRPLPHRREATGHLFVVGAPPRGAAAAAPCSRERPSASPPSLRHEKLNPEWASSANSSSRSSIRHSAPSFHPSIATLRTGNCCAVILPPFPPFLCPRPCHIILAPTRRRLLAFPHGRHIRPSPPHCHALCRVVESCNAGMVRAQDGTSFGGCRMEVARKKMF